MPVDPPRDAQGKIVPHDHAEIRDEHHVIRHTTPHDLHQTEKRLTSGAFSESSDGGMSVDIEEWMTADGLDALHYVPSAEHGAVRIVVGELRKLGLKVGWDPDGGNHRHHAAVWGIGNGSKVRRKVKALAVTLKKVVDEV